jgi:phosphoglycerate dehydrogenase-like enzyme
MGTKNPVIVLAAVEDPQFSMLENLPHVVCTDASACADQDATVVLNWSATRELLRPVLQMCPMVRWVHSRSAGLDDVLFPELVENDVILTNGSGVFSQSLGEFALGAILCFAKDFRRMIRNQQARRWEQFDVEEIAGQTVGIVGYGDIGRVVAARVRAMGMPVLANKRHPPEKTDPVIDRYYQPQELHEMLARCDYVVVSAPLTAETHHLISDAEFAAMKTTAVVINVGRGPVIDTAALLRALKAKQIKGAALDVFEQEPLPPEDALYRMKNVLLSPHCADHTAQWKEDAMRFFLEQYGRFLNGEPLKNRVNKRLGY